MSESPYRPIRLPYRVRAHSAADALEVAKQTARSDGFVVRGVGRVEATDLAHDVWTVHLTLRPKEAPTDD